MKKIITMFMTVAAFAAITTITTVSSCSKEKDACEGIVCNNGGTCNDGSCTCTAGYEGNRCDSVSRTKFLRTAVTVTEDCSSGNYPTDIVAGSAINEIKIKNLGKYSCPTDYY